MKHGPRRISYFLPCIFLIIAGSAQAQLCFDIFEDLTDPSLSCADAFYFVDGPEGDDRQDVFGDSSTGLLGAEFDGFDLFDPNEPNLAPPDNLLQPFFADTQTVSTTIGGQIDTLELRHRGAVSMGTRDSLFQGASYGSVSRITITPFTTDGSTDPILIDLDFSFDFTLRDPSDNATNGAARAAAGVIVYDDLLQPLFEFNGGAELDLDTDDEPVFFGDFLGAGSAQPSGPGIDDEFDIDIEFDSSFEATPGKALILDTASFGEIFTDGFESGDTSAWSASSPDTLVLRVSSGNPKLRFKIETQSEPFNINAGLNDAWFNPATAGQGFFITVFPVIKKMFLAMFTYDTERPDSSVMAQLGEPGHRWFTAFGDYDGGQAVLDIEITSGGVFDAADPAPTQDIDGNLIVDFSDCASGSITYNIPSVNQQGVIPIQRLANDNIALCESLEAETQAVK